MNVLVIYPNGNTLNPHSGAETRFWNLNYTMINLNFNLTVLHSIKSKGYEDKDLKKKCRKVDYVKRLNFLGFSDFYFTDLNPFFILKLYKIIRKQKFDFILMEFPWGFITTKFLAKKRLFFFMNHRV